MTNGLKCLKDYYPKASSATGRAEDQFFWLYSKHKTMPPAIFCLLVINRFLKPNRISPYLSRRIYPVWLHVRTHTRTSPPTVDVMTSKQRVFSQTGFARNTISSKCTPIGEFQWFRKNETKKCLRQLTISTDDLWSSIWMEGCLTLYCLQYLNFHAPNDSKITATLIYERGVVS